MKTLAIIVPSILALAACSSTDTSHQRHRTPTPVYGYEGEMNLGGDVHRTIQVDISRIPDRIGFYRFHASLVEESAPIDGASSNGSDTSRQSSPSSRSLTNLPIITVEEGKEAFVEVGPIWGRVFIDLERNQLNYEVRFVDDSGPLTSSGTISIGANQAR